MTRVGTVNLEALKHVLVTNPYNWVKAPTTVSILEEVLGRGLLTYEGNDHAFHRKVRLANLLTYHLPLTTALFRFANLYSRLAQSIPWFPSLTLVLSR